MGVSMNINTFQKQFNKTILKRGLDYYTNGLVEDIVQIDEHNWQAEVAGSSTYIVDIRTNKKGDILYADCDCPYDDDCKHIAAALYAIQHQQGTTSVQTTAKPSLQQLLQSQTKEQLVEIIMKVGKNHPTFIKELEILITAPDDALNAAEKLIVHHINAVQDHRSGFIPWNQSSKALRGVKTIQCHIGEHIENGEYLTAIQLSLLCFQHTFDALHYSDDSNGDFGDSIEESLAFIEDAIREGGDVWNTEQYETVYELIIKEAMHTDLDGWPDWRISFLQSCIPLCHDDAIEKKYVALLHSLSTQGDSWSANYMNKQLKELQFQIISSKYSNEDVEKFLEQNIEDAGMRERVILSAIEQGDYAKVLQLSQDGQKHNHDFSGIVNKWKRYAFTAHKALDNKEDMHELALQLLLGGDNEYYDEFKKLHSAQQWSKTFNQLLEQLKKHNPYFYATLIVEEKQYAHILDYCKERPMRIEQYYPHIREHYYEEVCALFIDTVTSSAKQASDRRRYQEVCRTITIMRKAGYVLEATQLIADLLQTYPKRRAFVDELRKLK